MLRFQSEEDFQAFQKSRQAKLTGNMTDMNVKPPKSLRGNKKTASPHAVAMAFLGSHPEAFEGNQEHYEQCRIFYEMERHRPDIYEALYAVPNGGLRHKGTAGRMRAEGQKKGELDINLDLPRGVYHGLRLELKYGKNTASDEQKAVCERHARNGYFAAVVWGAENAIKLLVAYADLSPGDTLEITG